MIWSVDGVEWTIPCSIERIAEIKASDISGMMMNKAYYNDVLGTYMQYTVTLAVPAGMEDQYVDLYELLSNPVGSHAFVMPYNNSIIEFTGRVEQVSDRWVYVDENHNRWRGVSFVAIANVPSKTIDAGQLVNYGLSAFPQSASATIGDLYQLTATGWQRVVYKDADEEYY